MSRTSSKVRSGGPAIRPFLIRTFLRRPFFLLSIILVILILMGIYPGSFDRDGEAYCAADGRRLLVSGTIRSREVTVNGYHLILDHLSFHGEDGNSSDFSRQVIASLNSSLQPGDRLQVFFSDGSSKEETIYGLKEENSNLYPDQWITSSAPEDQTDLFNSVRIGDRILLHGKCAQPEKATNPGQFDSRRYYLARRIVLKMSQVTMKELKKPSANLLNRLWLNYRNWIFDTRAGMQKGLLSAFGQKDASQIAAFVLGDGSGLDIGTRRLFRDGGLSWLVCVSSLHISVIGMLFYRFLRWRGFSFLLSSAGASLAVASYAMLTGFSISAQRALVTFVVWTGAQVFGRTRDTLSALSIAVCIILFRQPLALWDSSFLISFVCILSLEYLTPSVSKILKPRLSWQRRICSSFCLWFGSLPAVLWFFYQITPYSSILYPVMLPLMSLVLGFGMLGSIGGGLYLRTNLGFFLALGRVFAWPCRVLLKFLRLVCSAEQLIPGSVLILGRPALWQLVAYYFILVLFAMWVRRRKPGTFRIIPVHPAVWTRGVYAGICILLILMISLRVHPVFRFTCLDIGQGSCNLIEHKGGVYLFDAGSSSVSNVWQYRIGSCLKYYGIRKVDAVFLSHGDMDHIDGLGQMLDLYQPNLTGQNTGDVTIGRILVPDLPSDNDSLTEISDKASEYGIEICRVRAGERLKQNDLILDILSPSPERITGNDNEDCIVMLLRYKNLRILFTGDLEKEGEKSFTEAWKSSGLFGEIPGQETSGPVTSGEIPGQETSVPAIILIAGHHGSKNATSGEFLELVKPDLVFISCGKNNRYGHPAKEMLERLDAAGIPFHRTDLEGALQLS